MDGLLVGRFQPFHLGHVWVIRRALEMCDRLWLCIGSTNVQQSFENPFSTQERRQMIESSLDPKLAQKIKIYEIPDVDDHKKWLEKLDSIVPTYDVVITKDDVLKHLYSYRNKKIIDIPFENRVDYCGTTIRDAIISDMNWRESVPQETLNILEQIDASTRLRTLHNNS